MQDEEGYVLFVRKNALQILIPKYGLEGTLYVSGRKELDHVGFVYDEENQTQTCGNLIFHAFDPVTVQLSLDRSNVQHEKLVFQLVYPEVQLKYYLLLTYFCYATQFCFFFFFRFQNLVSLHKLGREKWTKKNQIVKTKIKKNLEIKVKFYYINFFFLFLKSKKNSVIILNAIY